MRGLILLFLMCLAAPAFAKCPSVVTDCPSPTFNNLTVGGTFNPTSISTSGTATLSGGGSFSGTFSGNHTLSGNVTITGTSALSGTVDFGAGAGSGPTDIIAQNTGNVRFTLGGSSSVLNFRNSGSTSILQLNTTVGSNQENLSLLPFVASPSGLVISGTQPASQLSSFTSNPGALSGTMTGTIVYPINYFTNTTDAVVATNGSVSLVGEQFNMGGATATGGRVAIQAIGSFSGPTNNKGIGNSGAFYGSGYFPMQAHTGDGGTDGTKTGAYGDFYSINPVVHSFSGATFLHGITGMEIDIEADSGSSTRQKLGMSIVQLNNDSAQALAPVNDGAIMITNQATTSTWRDFGLSFGNAYANWPFASTAGLITAYRDVTGTATSQATWGIDMAMATFPATGNPYDGGFFRTQGASMDGAGVLRLKTTYFTPTSAGLTIDAKGAVGASATVAAGGSGWVSSSYATDPYGGMWSVTASAGVATALTMVIAPTFPSTSTPANPVTLTAYGTANIDSGSTGLTANITWTTTANGVVVAGASTKLGFYGATAIVKATPSGACAGNTGCQALRDALGNLGLINTGSITN